MEGEESIYIDGTEQPIRRPTDKVEQKENYSGKKKRHTGKILVVTNEEDRIIGITTAYVGKSHDFGMMKEENLAEMIPSETIVYVDTGFEGIENLKEDIQVRKPKKKPKGRRLNGGEKLKNRIISKKRVKVEHAIGGMKRFRIVSDIFRGINRSMDVAFEIAAGLWNLRVTMRQEMQITQAGG